MPVLFFCSKDILHSYTTQIITLSNIVNIHEDIDIQVTTDLLENDQSLKMGYLLEKDLNLFGVIDLTTESIHMQWIFDISLHYIEAAA